MDDMRSREKRYVSLPISVQMLGKKRRKRFLRYLRAVQRLFWHPAFYLLLLLLVLMGFLFYDGRTLSALMSRNLDGGGGLTPQQQPDPLSTIKKPLRPMKIMAHGPCVHAQNLWRKGKGQSTLNSTADSIHSLGIHYAVPLLRFSRGQVFRLTPSADFDNLYQHLWHSKGYRMRYVLHKELKEKKLASSTRGSSSSSGGRYVVQYVQGRSKRPFNPTTERIQVVQPFTHNDGVFNFMKSPLEEVLFALRPFETIGEREIFFRGSIPLPDHEKERYSILECTQYHSYDSEVEEASPTHIPDWRDEVAAVLVNSHPFSYGCAVVIVRPSALLPQVSLFLPPLFFIYTANVLMLIPVSMFR